MKRIEKSIKLGKKTLTLSTGDVASQASGAVMATLGETVVLATVVAAPLRVDPGYFPLMVDYRVRLSAGGRIKGSRWVKRDGRPADEHILTARLIDRSIRPLFSPEYKREVQVIVQVLSIDNETPPDMVAATAVSAAIEASDIPMKGPVAITRIGLIDGKVVSNLTVEDMEKSDMDLVVSMANDSVVMIESSAKEATEENVLKGIKEAEKECKKLSKYISGFASEVGIKKEKIEKPSKDLDLEKKVKELSIEKIKDLIVGLSTKENDYFDLGDAKGAVKENFEDEKKEEAGKYFENLLNKEVKDMILSGKRPDGRKSDELRKLDSKVGVLPRVHGSGMFLRGQTQALTVATLGPSSLEQLIETAEGEESKRYIHHYAMPPYSVGEAGRFGFPSRREIGHGALAEKALEPVLPSKEDFPYTIHVVTEILSSNGSTSMASVCGSTLSLMDAGVPIKSPVAGIAMGLVMDEKKQVVLTDIVGLEDGSGDMDFKVAGTENGITAIQMDVKTLELKTSVLEEAFKQAKKARLEILASMEKAIKKPRKAVSDYAPKIMSVTIPVDKIGELIGPGGKTIKKLMADTETQIDVDDDGLVSVSSIKVGGSDEAIKWIEGLVKVVEAGEIYDGEVERIENYGAFVNILPNKSGLVHVSSMAEEFVKDPNEIVKIGDKVKVRVKKVDDMGRIDLSMILDPKKEKKENERRGRGGDRGGFSRGRSFGGGRGGGRRFNQNKGGRKRPSSDKSSGPHFPTSRLIIQDDKKR